MIHRTRQGGPPSGAPESGRDVTQIGDVFVEYSGALPTATDLATHFNPPSNRPLNGEEIFDMLKAEGIDLTPHRPRPKCALSRQ